MLAEEMPALVEMADRLPRSFAARHAFESWAAAVVSHESAAHVLRREMRTRPAARTEAERIAADGLALWHAGRAVHEANLLDALDRVAMEARTLDSLDRDLAA